MDDRAFEAACAERRQGLYAYILVCCRDPHLAEDIVQEALLIAYRKRTSYLPEADFGAWLASIARHVWFRERKRLGVRSRRLPQAVEDLALELTGTMDEEWDAERTALRHCLAKLGDEDRALIRRHFRDDEGYEAIAAGMSRTLSWVKVRMHRLRHALLGCVQRQLRIDDHG